MAIQIGNVPLELYKGVATTVTINFSGWADDLTTKFIDLSVRRKAGGTVLFSINEDKMTVGAAQIVITFEGTLAADSGTYSTWADAVANKGLRWDLTVAASDGSDAEVALWGSLALLAEGGTPAATSASSTVTVSDTGTTITVTVEPAGMSFAQLDALSALTSVDDSADLLMLGDDSASVLKKITWANFSKTIVNDQASKGSAVGADTLLLGDSAASFAAKKVTVTDIVALASASPGGSDTQIQYNNAGAFGGVSAFTWDGTQLALMGADFGIGTATPLTSITGNDQPLSVLATALYSGITVQGDTGIAPAITVRHPSGPQGYIMAASNSINIRSTSASYPITFQVDSERAKLTSTAFTLSSGVSLGIGTATPSAPLHVLGEARLELSSGVGVKTFNYSGIHGLRSLSSNIALFAHDTTYSFYGTSSQVLLLNGLFNLTAASFLPPSGGGCTLGSASKYWSELHVTGLTVTGGNVVVSGAYDSNAALHAQVFG